MTIKTTILASAATALILGLAACSGPASTPPATPAPEAAPAPAAAAPEAPAPDVSQLPAGAYKIDPAHSTLIFHVNHLGFSHYTGSFSSFTADLQLDPAKPETATLTALIDVNSLTQPSPPKGFKEELLNKDWIDKATTPQLKFESTSVTKTGPATADIAGNFTMKGVTKPVTLHATFNGGWGGIPQDPHARIGFSAKGELKRSDFGISVGIPAPGTTMGVSDEVAFEIEAEFSGPEMKAAPTATPPAQ